MQKSYSLAAKMRKTCGIPLRILCIFAAKKPFVTLAHLNVEEPPLLRVFPAIT
jgi:hypothetical protein